MSSKTNGKSNVRQLTALQRNVLSFIEGYIEGCGYPPTYREIMEGLEIKNNGSLQRAIEALEAKRYIKRKRTTWRNIEVLRSFLDAQQKRTA